MSGPADELQACFEGVFPASIATADADGMPNLAHLSQVHRVDGEHLALCWQFLNKTRRNLLANGVARLGVTDPRSASQYRLAIEYLRTDTSGPVFEAIRARQAALASQAGMDGMFELRGADICRVHAVELVPGARLAPAAPHRQLLSAMRVASERIRHAKDAATALSDTLDCLTAEFDIRHCIALLYDAPGQRLATIASRGYDAGAVAAAVGLGEGVIGVAARERMAIRVGHVISAHGYQLAMRAATEQCGFGEALAAPLGSPGLAEPRSQLAVPMLAGPLLVGVLYLESPFDLRFGHEDEDAIMALATHLGSALQMMQAGPGSEGSAGAGLAPGGADPLQVRHFAENDSIFLGDDYLIKGVAGSIFAALVSDYIANERTEFTNRALRLDTRIRLPDLSDNLEGRLLLLSRRLEERGAGIRIEKTGRGRFRLCSERPLKLVAEK